MGDPAVETSTDRSSWNGRGSDWWSSPSWSWTTSQQAADVNQGSGCGSPGWQQSSLWSSWHAFPASQGVVQTSSEDPSSKNNAAIPQKKGTQPQPQPQPEQQQQLPEQQPPQPERPSKTPAYEQTSNRQQALDMQHSPGQFNGCALGEQAANEQHQPHSNHPTSWWQSSGSTWNWQKNDRWSGASWQTNSWPTSTSDGQTLDDVKDLSKVDDSSSRSIWGEPRGTSAWSIESRGSSAYALGEGRGFSACGGRAESITSDNQYKLSWWSHDHNTNEPLKNGSSQSLPQKNHDFCEAPESKGISETTHMIHDRTAVSVAPPPTQSISETTHVLQDRSTVDCICPPDTQSNDLLEVVDLAGNPVQANGQARGPDPLQEQNLWCKKDTASKDALNDRLAPGLDAWNRSGQDDVNGSLDLDKLGSFLMEGFLQEGREKYGQDSPDLLFPTKSQSIRSEFGKGPSALGDVPSRPGAGGMWSNFKPGQMSLPSSGPGGWADAASSYTNTNDKMSIRLNKDLAAKWSAKDILDTAGQHIAQFDIINAVTALHRVAKSTDKFEARRDRHLSSTLTRLIDKVVAVVTKDDELIEGKEITKTAWALAKLGLGTRQTMDQIAVQVVKKVDELDGQGLSNVGWAFATVRQMNVPLMDVISREALKQLEDFDPQGLSNSIWAFAKLPANQNKEFLSALASEATLRVEDFDPQGVANIGWAYATLGICEYSLMDALAEELIGGISRWSHQNLANLTWAFAKLKIMNQAMVDAIANETIQTIYEWNGQGLANVTWAFAKLSVKHKKFYDTVEVDVLKKVYDFSPQNLVNIAWAYAKLGFKRQALMDAIAENIIRKAADFNPQHCSNSIWAFGTLGMANVPVLNAIAPVVRNNPNPMGPQDLANIAWAFSKLVQKDEPLFGAIAIEVRRKCRVFQPQNLSITAYAFSQLGIVNEPMVDAIVDEAVQKIVAFDGQGLSNLSQSMAKLALRRDRMLAAITAETPKKVSTFTNQELAMIAWSYAKMGMFEDKCLRTVTDETLARLDRLTPQDLSVLIWAYARAGMKSKEVLDTLAWEVVKRINLLIPQDLANISWGYATLGIENVTMMDAIAKEAVKKIARFSTQDLANTMWAFAKLGLYREELVDTIISEITRRLAECQPQHLSISSWALAKLGVVKQSFLDVVAKGVIQKINGFDAQGVGNIMWSFGVLGVKKEEMIAAVVERAMAVTPQLTAQEISNIAFGCQALQQDDLLLEFLQATASRFQQFAGSNDGASWVDFANIVRSVVETDGAFEGSKDVDGAFRRLLLEPTLETLTALQSVQVDRKEVLHRLQEILDINGLPYFGPWYTRDALAKLRIQTPSAGSSWAKEARGCCFEKAGGWKIPGTDNILCYAAWDVRCRGAQLENPGCTFVSSWSEAISDEIKDMLRPLRQHIKRDMHPERVALLELLDNAGKVIEGGVGAIKKEGLEGRINIYVSQYPCISCLGIFCQLMRWCPKVELEIDFDNAWATCCGIPRFAATTA